MLPIHKKETKVGDFSAMVAFSASGNKSNDPTVISKGNTSLFKKKTEEKDLPDVTTMMEPL